MLAQFNDQMWVMRHPPAFVFWGGAPQMTEAVTGAVLTIMKSRDEIDLHMASADRTSPCVHEMRLHGHCCFCCKKGAASCSFLLSAACCDAMLCYAMPWSSVVFYCSFGLVKSVPKSLQGKTTVCIERGVRYRGRCISYTELAGKILGHTYAHTHTHGVFPRVSLPKSSWTFAERSLRTFAGSIFEV